MAGIDGYMVGILALGVLATIMVGCFRIAEHLKKNDKDGRPE